MFSVYDVIVIVLGAMGLFFWVQGARKKSVMDSAIGLVVGGLAMSVYFFVFQGTRLPWLAAGLCGVYLLGVVSVT